MNAPGPESARKIVVPFVRYGRKAIKHVRTLFDRFWLQAAVRRIVIYVRLTSSSGKSDAEFPLLEALRTKPGVPRPAAFDSNRTFNRLVI